MSVAARVFGPLLICAAALSAAFAHYAIDVVGDYALAHDTYDRIAHDSRQIVVTVALVATLIAVARGVRLCFELATRDRGRLTENPLGWAEAAIFVSAVVLGALALVPAMEWGDGLIDHAPVHQLAAAFGGSIFVGVATTLVCASLVAAAIFALARWLLAHRDSLLALLTVFATRRPRASLATARTRRAIPIDVRHRSPRAHRLSKRGPPRVVIVSTMTHTHPSGGPRGFLSFASRASACRAFDSFFAGCAGRGPNALAYR